MRTIWWPSTPQVQDWAGILASPPVMLKHKSVVYFPLPHKWSIMVCSEQPSGNKHIKQGLVHPFVLQMNLLVPTWRKSPPEVIWEHTLVWKNKGTPKILQYSKIPLYPFHPQVQNKCSSEDWQWHRKVSSNYGLTVRSKITSRIKNRVVYKPVHWLVKQVNVLVSTRRGSLLKGTSG